MSVSDPISDDGYGAMIIKAENTTKARLIANNYLRNNYREDLIPKYELRRITDSGSGILYNSIQSWEQSKS